MRTFLHQNSHRLLALGIYLVVYLLAFALLERFVTPYYIIHCALDDLIPFCSWAIIPYFFWFLWIPFVILLVMICQPEEFQRMYWGMVIGCACALAIYAIFPNGLDLRGRVAGTDFLAQMVRLLYRVDTATNVCPSLHVYQSVCVMLAIIRSERLKCLRIPGLFITAAIAASTVLLDQHSVIDVAMGLLLCVSVDSIYHEISVHHFRHHGTSAKAH